MIRSRATADLFATMKAPRDRQDYFAAIGERAGKIVSRVMPVRRTPHGFYDPAGFVEAARHSAARNQLYRDLCASLGEKAARRFNSEYAR